MPRSTLFAYMIEEDDDKLIITVEGPFATGALRSLRASLIQGRGLSILSRLSPLGPLGRLMSATVDLTSSEEAADSNAEPPDRRLDLQRIFNQGIDQNFESFDQQLREFRNLLDGTPETEEAVSPDERLGEEEAPGDVKVNSKSEEVKRNSKRARHG
jgi:hypothetical protein